VSTFDETFTFPFIIQVSRFKVIKMLFVATTTPLLLKYEVVSTVF